MSSIRSLNQLGIAEVVGLTIDGELVGDQTRKGRRIIALRKLLVDLLALGIRPFKDEDVNAYQKSKEKFYHRLGKIGCRIDDWNGDGTTLMCGTLVLAVSTIGLMVLMPVLGIPVAMMGYAFAVAVFAPIVATAVIGVGGYVLYKCYYPSYWMSAPLDELPHSLARRVPKPVRALAASIQKARLDVEIRVEYLQLDPFLTVCVTTSDGDTVAYRVAVWDERGFRIAER